MNTQNYKATFILDTKETEKSFEQLTDHLKGVIASIGGKVSDVNDMGDKEFARVTSKKSPSGRYLQIDFEGPKSVPSDIQEKLRLDNSVNRVMVQAV